MMYVGCEIQTNSRYNWFTKAIGMGPMAPSEEEKTNQQKLPEAVTIGYLAQHNESTARVQLL